MAAINVTSVHVLNNPSYFLQPLQFEIQYECLYNLQHDLEWKLTYVGSAESEKYDQVLDSVLVGPVVPGQYKFVFQADAPDHTKLPQDDIVGVTVLLLTCSYQDKEFIRIGYYVNNDYADEETRENPPETPQMDRLVRSILEDKPRVTRFPVEFDPMDQVPTVGGDPSTAPLAAPQMETDVQGAQPSGTGAVDGSTADPQSGAQAQGGYTAANGGFGANGFGGWQMAGQQAVAADAGGAMEE